MALSRFSPLLRNYTYVSLRHVFHSSQSGWALEMAQRPICQTSLLSLSQPKSCNRLILRAFRSSRSTKPIQPPAPSESFSILKSAAYVTGVCSCTFLGAMIWNYENMRKYYKILNHKKTHPEANKRNSAIGELKYHLDAMWAQIWTIGLVAANVGVWVMWNIPRLQGTMVKYFSSAPGRPLVSMTLSSFSHISFFHMFINMYVLVSFLPLTIKLLGREHCSAFYISAGTMSAFTSLALNKLLRRPNLMSVGASGAIMGLLGAVAVTYPDIKLQIAFVSEIFPHSFSASSGLKAIIAFDLLGLALGWRVLDHAGHLGGVIFGILYAKYGKNFVWGKTREQIIKRWHELRGKP